MIPIWLNDFHSVYTCSQSNKSNKNVHTHFTRHAHHFHTMRGNSEFIYITFAFQSVLIWNKLLQNINIHVSYTHFNHLLKIPCYPMLLPLDMINSGILLLVFLRIMCPTHPLPFPFLLSKMTFDYLSFYINYIIDTDLHNIILQFLCYIFNFLKLDSVKRHIVT